MSILGLTNGGHDSYYIRFMPSRLAWVIKVKDDLDTWEDQEVPIKYLVLNPASLRTGWGKIAEGMSPEWEWDNEAGLFWSEEQQYFYDVDSAEFYCPESELWYNPETDEWHSI